MSSLLEQDSFKQLIYSRNSKVQGLDPLRDLQTTLAGRLHSVYVTSRVWSRSKAVAGALVQTARGCVVRQSCGFPLCLLDLAESPLQQITPRQGCCASSHWRRGSWLLCATTVTETLSQRKQDLRMQVKNLNRREDLRCHLNKHNAGL